MTRSRKFLEYKALFYDYFISEGDNQSGCNIPMGSVVFEGGKSVRAEVGEGTTNLASYLLFLLSEYLGTEDPILKMDRSKVLLRALQGLERLAMRPLQEAQHSYPDYEFSYEPGFFLKDDISTFQAKEFCTQKVVSAYGMFYEGQDEDPCFNPFVSQEAIWNLLPTLSLLCEFPLQTAIKDLSRKLLLNILGFVIRNNHTIYNPYLSKIYHSWTFCPSRDAEKVPIWRRKEDRDHHFRNRIKVKGDANNWLYAYGFRKTFDRFALKKANRFESFLYSLIYYPFTFAMEKLWSPAMRSIFGAKIESNSYHCLAVSGEVWYGGMKNFDKHLKKCFEKGESSNLYFVQMLKSDDLRSVDSAALKSYLEKYPEPKTNGRIYCPLDYMIAYNFYKYITS